jgi:hypothetical protein
MTHVWALGLISLSLKTVKMSECSVKHSLIAF